MPKHWFQQFRLEPDSLATIRRLYALALLVAYWPEWLWVSGMADPFYQPPIGLAMFLDGPPPIQFFLVLNALGIVASVCLLLGRSIRTASAVVPGVLWVGNSFEYAYGKVDHDILLLLIPLAGAVAGWDGRRKTRAWPVAVFALAISLAMSASGMSKAMTGWLDPNRGAVRSFVTSISVVVGRDAPLSAIALDAFPRFVWEGMDWAAVVLEVSFLPAVLRLRWFHRITAFACLFHLANITLFMIPFFSNVLAYGFFVRWPSVSERKAPVWLVAGAGAFTAATYLLWGNPIEAALLSVGLAPGVWIPSTIVTLGAVVAVAWIVRCSGWFLPRVQIHRDVWTDPRVIAFDGHCGLCNGWVDFILRHDRREVWRFTPLQSPSGLHVAGVPQAADPASVVVVREGWRYTRSTAVLIAVSDLGGLWRTTAVLLLVPAAIRDVFYWVVARLRYRVFGRSEICRIPGPEERARFL